MAERTVLYDRHVDHGGRMVDFGGWELPVQYAGILAEHRACRDSAVVFDTSHMGQLHLAGSDAPAALSAVCTQDAAAMRVGKCRYGFLLNDSGGVIDDTILMRLGPEEYLLVVNAGTRGDDVAWLSDRLGGDVELTDRTAGGWAKIDVQGPEAFVVLAGLVEPDLAELGYFTVASMQCCGRSCVISRTGYTGELGYEVMAAGEDLLAIHDAVMSAGDASPAGLGARDSLRLEMGYPLYGHELSLQRTPIEAGLGKFLDLDRDFIGVQSLRKQLADGPGRQLVALAARTRRRAAEGDAIVEDGRGVGEVTSAAFSPSLEISIAMAYVEPASAETGRELTIQTRRAELPARIVTTPFYRRGTCRTRDLRRETS